MKHLMCVLRSVYFLLTYSTGSGSLYSNEEYEVAKAEGDG